MSQTIYLTPTTGPGSGTVTSISAATGITLTPNPITGTGTVGLTIPVAIANGGTNATSMTNTDGVVYFDGTRLVTTAVGTATQVLTSNGTGVAPTFQPAPSSPPLAASNSFFAILTTPQSVPLGTNAVIQFDTTLYNYGNYFNTSTYTFTVPVDGVYQFHLSCMVTPGNLTDSLNIFKNGSFYISAIMQGNTTQASMMMSPAIPLVASNTITAVYSTGSSGAAIMQSGSTGFFKVYFSGYRLF